MSEPFMGEIRMMSFIFAPKGWALCNGQFMPINQNQALFSLLGTQFGGNGQTNFALPDLRGRVPLHASNEFPTGAAGGQETVTLGVAHLPAHTHALNTSTGLATSASPAGALPGKKGRLGRDIFAAPDASGAALSPDSVRPTGGSQAHNNMQPFLAINFVIALQGIFPSSN